MTPLTTSILLLAILAFFLRGDSLHNLLVLESGNILQNAGFETYQEHPKKLPNGSTDFVDVLAKKSNFLICIEVETSARYVLTNAAKAEQLGIPLIVIVPTRSVKKSVQNKLGKTTIRPGGCEIYILLLAQFKKEVTNCFSLFSSANSDGKTKK